MIVAAVLLFSGRAAAQAFAAQASVAATTGVTDNADSVSSNLGDARGDTFVGIDPLIGFIVDTPRLVSTLTLSGSFRNYFNETQANTRTANVGFALGWDAAPTWRVTSSLTGTYGETSAFEPLDAVGAVPAGGGTYFQAAADASLAKALSPSWRVADTVRVVGFFPQGGLGDGLTLHNDVQGQYSFQRDALQLGLGTDFDWYDSPVVGTSTSGIVSLAGEWLHELSPLWSFNVGGGVGVAATQAGVSADPIGHAALSYRRLRTSFTLRIEEAVSGNALVGQTLVDSRATLGAAIQVTETFGVLASGGVTHGSVLGGDGTVDAVHAEAGVSWRFVDNLSVDASYTFLHQTSDQDAVAPPLTRNTATLSLRAFWPVRRPESRLFRPASLEVRQSEELESSQVRR